MKYQDDSDALEVFRPEHKAMGSFTLITEHKNSTCMTNMTFNKAVIHSYWKYAGSFK